MTRSKLHRSARRSVRRWRRSLARRIDVPTKTRGAPPTTPTARPRSAVPVAAPPEVPALIREEHVPHDPPAPMTRHELLAGLHERLAPRTYLEIGVQGGGSLALSRSRTIAVDPVLQVSSELCCDLQLVKSTSDAFFARPDPVAHLGGPVELAFVDGMHLAEFAYRDVANLVRHLAPTGVVVLDDMLPRTALEAARDRRTIDWAGDVYKVAAAVRVACPGAVVLPLHTAPTGTVLIAGLDPASTALHDAYESLLPGLTVPDPQDVPAEVLARTHAVDPRDLLASDVWERLRALRDAGAGPNEVAATLDPWRAWTA